MIDLAAGKCILYRSGEPPLTVAEIEDLMFHVPHWQTVAQDNVLRLRRVFKNENYA